MPITRYIIVMLIITNYTSQIIFDLVHFHNPRRSLTQRKTKPFAIQPSEKTPVFHDKKDVFVDHANQTKDEITVFFLLHSRKRRTTK